MKKISSLNKTYRVSIGEDHCITLESEVDCSAMKTYGWMGSKEKASTRKNMCNRKAAETSAPKDPENTTPDDKVPSAEGSSMADDNE